MKGVALCKRQGIPERENDGREISDNIISGVPDKI